MRFLAALGLFILTACQTLNPAESLSPIPSPVELDSADDGWKEISAGVVQHAGGGSDGRLFVFASGKGLTRRLNQPDGGPFDIKPLPDAPAIGGHWSNDQQTVQLANGDILLSWNGYSNVFDDQFHNDSEWWSKWPTKNRKKPEDVGYPDDRNGIRPAQLLWRYSAKDDKWLPATALDSAPVGAVNKTGTIERSWCAQGVPWVAGFDRPELYADPWGVDPSDPSKQRLFISIRCSRKDGGVLLGDSEQLFTSDDSGTTWNDSGVRLDGFMASVTATPSGRVFLLQGTRIFYSDDHGKTLAAASKAGFDIATAGLPYNTLQGCTMGVGRPWVAPTPIAAVGPSAVLAVYPAVENVTVHGMAIARQVAVVVFVNAAPGADPTPLVAPVATIRADAADGSVFLPALITDTRAIGGPATMMYWLETTSRPGNPGTDDVTIVARYAMFAGIDNFPGPISLLSGSAGFKTKMVASFGFGDYMEGAFYYDEALKTRNFVAVWPQQNEKSGKVTPFARIITFSDKPLPAPSINDFDVVARAPLVNGVIPITTPCDACLRVKDQ